MDLKIELEQNLKKKYIISRIERPKTDRYFVAYCLEER